jgi:hypothetical protein
MVDYTKAEAAVAALGRARDAYNDALSEALQVDINVEIFLPGTEKYILKSSTQRPSRILTHRCTIELPESTTVLSGRGR